MARRDDWKARLMPAYFRNERGGREALFHVETGGRESGRRVVVHQFPKKDLPYAEDMGRRAIEFTVRGYCIVYTRNTNEPLYRENYLIARDALVEQLELEGTGVLQLPTHHGGYIGPMRVVCTRYRLTEEQRLGGYCTFDMTFIEQGAPPFKEALNANANLDSAAERLRDRLNILLAKPNMNKDAQRVEHARRRERTRREAESALRRQSIREEFEQRTDPTEGMNV